MQFECVGPRPETQSRGSSILNLSPILNYAFDESRGNGDLNSSLIFNNAFDVSLRVDFANTFL